MTFEIDADHAQQSASILKEYVFASDVQQRVGLDVRFWTCCLIADSSSELPTRRVHQRRESSVRSAMIVATSFKGNQNPSGMTLVVETLTT